MNLAARMTLDTASFTGPLQGVMGGLRGLLGLAGAAGGVAGAVAGIRSGLKMGSELSDLKDRTGAAVGELVLLRQAFEDTGVGADALPTTIQFLQKSLSGFSEEGKTTVQTFQRLGLDMKALAGMSAAEQMQTVGRAISALGSDADKTEAAMTIFGRSGAALKQFFADPEAIEKARAGLGSLPQVLERDAAMMNNLDDALGRLKTQSRGLFVGVASELAPALSGVVDSLKGIDLTAVGKQIGGVVATLVEAFRQGRLGELVGLSIKSGLQTAFSAITKADFWRGLGNVIIGSLGTVQSFLMKAFTTPIVMLSAGIRKVFDDLMEWSGVNPVLAGALFGPTAAAASAGHKAKSFEYHKQAAEADNRWLMDLVGGAGSDALTEGQRQLAAAWSAAASEVTPEKERLSSVLDDLSAAVAARAEEIRAAATPGANGAPSSPALPSSARGGHNTPDADRWAKVGLFVGSGGGPALDYNRRTATATEKLAALAVRTNEILNRLQPAAAATWANA